MSAFWSGVDCYFDAFCVYVLIYDAQHLRFSILINSLSPSLSLSFPLQMQWIWQIAASNWAYHFSWTSFSGNFSRFFMVRALGKQSSRLSFQCLVYQRPDTNGAFCLFHLTINRIEQEEHKIAKEQKNE